MVSVGPSFADDYAGEHYLQLYAVVPNRTGDDFVTYRVLLSTFDNPLLAQVNRTALIIALEPYFGRVQIFGDELPFAKYVGKQWPHAKMDQIVAGIIRKRGLN